MGTFSDAAIEDPTWTAPAATTSEQEVTLTLVVTSSNGLTNQASVNLTVRAGNVSLFDDSVGSTTVGVIWLDTISLVNSSNNLIWGGSSKLHIHR